jgi:hypothetical protein
MKKLSFAYFSKSFWDKLNTFRKKEKPQGVTAPPPTAKQTIDTRKINKAIDELAAEIRSSVKGFNPTETPEEKLEREREAIRKEKEREKQWRPSTIDKHRQDHTLQQKFFKGYGMPGWKVAEHNWKVGRALTLSSSLELFRIITERGIQSMADLDKLTDEELTVILDRVIDKPTFLKLVRVCNEIHRDISPKDSIFRKQQIMDRLSKVWI